MVRKYLLPILAILGIIIGAVAVVWSQRKPPVLPILFPPPTSPYRHSIAGAGIIEAIPMNVSIGSPFNEIITAVFVREGDEVKEGEPLLQLDTRAFQAQVQAAKANVKAASVNLEDKQIQFSFYKRLKDTKAVSEQIYQQARYGVIEAEANMSVAKANLREAEINIERSTIRAPMDGKIFQVNISKGELAPVQPVASAQSSSLLATQGCLILMGEKNPLQLRVDIDEDDAWRFQEGARATAFVRGNSTIHFPLEYYRVQPYIVPKSYFTGATTERVDTRVLQVLYRFEKNDLPVYAGQVLDVFIESEPFRAE